MLRVLLVFASLTVSSACSTKGPAGDSGPPGATGPAGPPGPAGTSSAKSGSRLKLYYDVGADGMKAPIPSRYWDSTLGTDCYSNGSKCIPAGVIASDLCNYGDLCVHATGLFSDPACATPVN